MAIVNVRKFSLFFGLKIYYHVLGVVKIPKKLPSGRGERMTPEGYVTIKVLFFARAREFTGEKEVSLEVPSKIQGKELLGQIIRKFKLDALKCNVILALNETWVDLNSELSLKNEDEIAVIPPLSGG